jgi:exopolyphosphatase / guanosine-5'-triphosphate,3'-diphosphate pyrophosphatase
MTEYSTIAAVDLGSNSFRLQAARVVGEQIYPLDSLKETVRLAAGLTSDKTLDEESQERALTCLRRFGERLRGLPAAAVRAVGTNTLRVAKNAKPFLKTAQKALGFPIEIVAGHEEARLIYLGVAHSLPPNANRRLVVDIGGGSTECIIGAGFEPTEMESLYMGCVSFSRAFFPNGKISNKAMREAQVAAGAELQSIAAPYLDAGWSEAVGSSGTARAIADILEQLGWSTGEITRDGLYKLREKLVDAGDMRKLELPSLREDRKPVLPGGLAILLAVFRELNIERMQTTEAGLRDGVLWDMLGRFHHQDVREATVRQFMLRYHVDALQAERVERLGLELFAQIAASHHDPKQAAQFLGWAARLHEIGISIAYSGFHKHSAYVLDHAEMPGFSKMDQMRLALYALAQRGSLTKAVVRLEDRDEWLPILALRLATIFLRGRTKIKLPAIKLDANQDKFTLTLDPLWVERNPLTEAALASETKAWKAAGLRLQIEAAESKPTESVKQKPPQSA